MLPSENTSPNTSVQPVDPVEELFSDLLAKLQRRAEQPDAALTCNDLMEIMGPNSHVLALLVFSLLNLLPAPPGYNFAMGLIIILLSAAMLVGHEVRLGGFIGRLKLPKKAILKLLELTGKLVGWIVKISSPRLLPVTSPVARPVIALYALVLGISMLVPIPATNMLPSIGLALICSGYLNRDGLLTIWGVLVGLVGLVLVVVAVWIVVALAVVIEDAVDPNELS